MANMDKQNQKSQSVNKTANQDYQGDSAQRPQTSQSRNQQSTSDSSRESRDFSNSDLKQDQSSQRANRTNDIQDDNIGGRSAGGNAGTGGVSTNDVGNSRASKQTRLDR